MADYYSILKKTVSGLPANTAENRKLVYSKARTAIDRQLRGITPPPSDEAISRQMSALEAAIEQIESENEVAAPPPPATAAAMQTPPAAPQNVEARPVVPVPPAAATPVAPAPEPVMRAEPRPMRAEPPLNAPRPAQPAAQQPASAPAQAPQARPTQPQPQQARPASPQAAAPQAPSRPGQPPRPAGAVPPRRGEPPPYDTSLDAVRDVDRPVRVRGAQTVGRPEEGGKTSALTMIIVLLVIIGLFAGGGYALWRNKDPLMSALGFGTTEVAQPEEDTEAPAANEAEGTAKEEARLGQDGQTQAPAADANTDTAEDETPPESTANEPVTPPAAEETSPADTATAETAPAENPEVTPVEPAQPAAPAEQAQPAEQAPADTTAQADTTTQAQPEAQVAPTGIAQKAYLYEEGAAGAGATRDNAAVIWSLDQQPPADGQPPEPVIKGRLEVPGRGLVLDIVIKRNIDEALSASHIIELYFQVPPDFSGGSIDNVARFVMKANEQARGEGLVAVPVKIDSGYFLIALNNLETATATNKRLLLESSWIDIPLGYTTGRRALVTLEKGAIGDKVFRDAFADWDKR